jgi:hypothetical protein
MLRINGSLRILAPQMALVPLIVDRVFEEEGILICVLTSGYRPKGPGSIHPYGLALDFDAIEDLTADRWERIRSTVRAVLGSEYQVLAHDAGSGMHLHVEFDYRGQGETITT